MLYTEHNELGKIEFDEKIVGNIIRRVADSFDGKVMLSGIRGKIKRSSKGFTSDDITFMNMKKTEDGYVIDVYVVLRFGTSIRRTSHELIDKLKEQIPKITDMEVSKVRVLITGVISKNISKRNIEVEG